MQERTFSPEVHWLRQQGDLYQVRHNFLFELRTMGSKRDSDRLKKRTTSLSNLNESNFFLARRIMS